MPEHSIWLSKPAALAAWLGAGVVAFAAFAALTLNSLAADWAQSLRVVLLPSVMTVVLAAEAGAVIVARRCAASWTSMPPQLCPASTHGPAASPVITEARSSIWRSMVTRSGAGALPPSPARS